MRHLRASGWTNDDIRFGVETLTRETDDGALVYRDVPDALEGLRSLTKAPSDWLARTRLVADDETHHLGFRALYSLAWLATQVNMDVMLGES